MEAFVEGIGMFFVAIGGIAAVLAALCGFASNAGAAMILTGDLAYEAVSAIQAASVVTFADSQGPLMIMPTLPALKRVIIVP